MTTPSGLTVRPAGTWGLLGTESPLFTVAAGNTTYSYTVIARDIYGGLTIPATPVSISSGLASIGKQTAIISKLTRTNDRITVVLKAAPASPLVAGRSRRTGTEERHPVRRLVQRRAGGQQHAG